MTLFYIDTENVQSNWQALLRHMEQEDRYFLFCTEATSPKAKELSDSGQVIDVSAGTPNALDFQLATFLGSMVSKFPDARHCIISKDLGYNAVCNLWRSKGFKVSRHSPAGYIKHLKGGVK